MSTSCKNMYCSKNAKLWRVKTLKRSRKQDLAALKIHLVSSKADERGRSRGAKYLGPRLVRGRNLGKTSGIGCYYQDGWGPVMFNHLLVLGPDPGSRQPWFHLVYKLSVLTGCLASYSKRVGIIGSLANFVVKNIPALHLFVLIFDFVLSAYCT